MISIIIPTYKRSDSLKSLLTTIKENSYYDNEVIILTPQPQHVDDLKSIVENTLILNDNSRKNGKRVKGLWAIINHGINLAKNKYVCWLNDDCLVNPNWDKIAVSYFQTNDALALVVLKTKGLANIQEYTTINTKFGLKCANYGVLDKSTGIRFDEHYDWFHGDSDITLECELIHHKKSIATEENCIIHYHLMDEVRVENEKNKETRDPDQIYFQKKWKYWVKDKDVYRQLTWRERIKKRLKE